MKIYISDQIPKQIQNTLPSDNVTYFDHSSIDTVDLTDIDIAWGFDKTVKAIIDTPRNQLKWIQSFSAGIDYFPKEKLLEQDVTLTNTSGIHGVAIANTVMLYALFFARDMNLVLQMRNAKKWNGTRNFDELSLMSDKKWLIFGTGHIGQEIAKQAQALGGYVTGVNHSGHAAEHFNATVSDADYDDVLKNVDVVVNILPLTNETLHMFDRNFFNKLDHLNLFINVGRGASVDTNALLMALDNGCVTHAALDVFEEEPLSSDSPLWNYPQVLITPHNSALSSHMLTGVHDIFVKNLQAYLETGQPSEKIVDLKRGY